MKYKYYKYIILFLVIIILYSLFYMNESYETQMKNYDIVISINVHEKVNFLLKQLDNIKENVKCNYAIILNCNDYMYNEFKNITLPDNVYVNNDIINKKYYHGSIANGIYSNIQYALKNFIFKYFICCSSRNYFDNNMNLEDLNKVINLTKPYNDKEKDYSTWHWPQFIKTLLAKHFLDQNKKLYVSAHEGLMFTYNGCEKIVDFLENNKEIKNDLFNFDHCVEEFSLQTILVNTGGEFYYIGNGVGDEKISSNNDTNMKFMYKVTR